MLSIIQPLVMVISLCFCLCFVWVLLWFWSFNWIFGLFFVSNFNGTIHCCISFSIFSRIFFFLYFSLLFVSTRMLLMSYKFCGGFSDNSPLQILVNVHLVRAHTVILLNGNRWVTVFFSFVESLFWFQFHMIFISFYFQIISFLQSISFRISFD